MRAAPLSEGAERERVRYLREGAGAIFSTKPAGFDLVSGDEKEKLVCDFIESRGRATAGGGT